MKKRTRIRFTALLTAGMMLTAGFGTTCLAANVVKVDDQASGPISIADQGM